MKFKTTIKYLSLATLPVAFMACSSGNCNTDTQGISIGQVTGGASVMVSSGNIQVDAAKSGTSVATLSVLGLRIGQSVTLVMSNPQSNPSLVFAPKGNNTTKANKVLNNNSNCIVTAQSPNCTITSEVAGAQNGGYVANVAYVSENPNGTGTLKPIPYTISGGSPTPPGPSPVAGEITMSLSSESIDVGTTTTATYRLNGASGFTTAVTVTATSSDPSVLNAYNDVNSCALTVAQPSCTIIESGLAAGSATIRSAATGYRIDDSNTITVTAQPAPAPVYGSIGMSLSAESLYVGESIIVTYTLSDAHYLTAPVTVFATSSAESVLNSANSSCEVSMENPTCTIVESGLTKGSAIISSNAGSHYGIANSNTITVKPAFSNPVSIVINNNYAYIANAVGGTVTMCNVGSSGALSNCTNSGATELNGPRGIAIKNNYAYIANMNGNTVSICNVGSSGELSNCTNSGATELNAPVGITIKNNYVYIANMNGNTVTMCSVAPSGALGGCTNSGATGLNGSVVTTINNNYAYITNIYGNTVTMCSVAPSGTLGSCTDSGATGLRFPVGIIINNDYAYIANNGNRTVSMCNVAPSGVLGGCTDSGATELSSPNGIIINNNYAYIANAGSSTVTMCNVDPSGALSSCSNAL